MGAPEQLELRVLAFIRKHRMIPSGSRVLMSMSAGKDSMCMAHILLSLKDELSFEPGIFHLNHLTRGAESDADEVLVRNFASEHHIPFFGRTYDFTKEDSRGRSFEEFARDVRYSMLAEICSEHKYDLIAVAHNLEDSAETMLMRIFSGTGIIGLKGILPVRDSIIRPVRCCSVQEITSYLRRRNISWREDASNKDIRYKRNYIRNRILPVISEAYPDFAVRMDRLAELSLQYAEMADDLVQLVSGGSVTGDNGEVVLDAWKFADRKTLFFHAAASVLEKNGLPVSQKILDEIRRGFMSEKPELVLYSVRGLTVEKIRSVRGPVLRIRSSVPSIPAADWEYSFPADRIPERVELKESGLSLTVRRASQEEFRSADSNISLFFAVPVSTHIIAFRNRRNGDRILLEKGSKKIKDLFIDNKISRELRNRIPVLTADGETAAVMTGFLTGTGSRVSEKFFVSSESERIFRIDPVQSSGK